MNETGSPRLSAGRGSPKRRIPLLPERCNLFRSRPLVIFLSGQISSSRKSPHRSDPESCPGPPNDDDGERQQRSRPHTGGCDGHRQGARLGQARAGDSPPANMSTGPMSLIRPGRPRQAVAGEGRMPPGRSAPGPGPPGHHSAVPHGMASLSASGQCAAGAAGSLPRKRSIRTSASSSSDRAVA